MNLRRRDSLLAVAASLLGGVGIGGGGVWWWNSPAPTLIAKSAPGNTVVCGLRGSPIDLPGSAPLAKEENSPIADPVESTLRSLEVAMAKIGAIVIRVDAHAAQELTLATAIRLKQRSTEAENSESVLVIFPDTFNAALEYTREQEEGNPNSAVAKYFDEQVMLGRTSPDGWLLPGRMYLLSRKNVTDFLAKNQQANIDWERIAHNLASYVTQPPRGVMVALRRAKACMPTG